MDYAKPFGSPYKAGSLVEVPDMRTRSKVGILDAADACLQQILTGDDGPTFMNLIYT